MRIKNLSIAMVLSAGIAVGTVTANARSEKDNEVVKESRKIEAPVSKIDASTGISVTYIQGTPQGMIIEGRRSDIDALDIYTEKGELNIKRKSVNNIFNQVKFKNIKVTVTAPGINEFDISTGCSLNIARMTSSSEVEIETGTGSSLNCGYISAPKVDIELSTGASGVIKELISDRVSIDVATGSTFSVNGQGKKISIDASTGSTVDASRFKSQIADIDASTGSSVKYNSKSADVNSSTGSSVKNYAGD